MACNNNSKFPGKYNVNNENREQVLLYYMHPVSIIIAHGWNHENKLTVNLNNTDICNMTYKLNNGRTVTKRTQNTFKHIQTHLTIFSHI